MQDQDGEMKKWQLPFFSIWTGQAFSLVGSRLVQFALVWWLTESTGSATVLAMATLVAILPGVILGPFVGTLVDRWNRQVVMIAADGFVALVTAWLAYLFWTGSATMWHVYAAMLALVENSDRRRKMGLAAREYMESRSFKAAFDQTWEMFGMLNAQKQQALA